MTSRDVRAILILAGAAVVFGASLYFAIVEAFRGSWATAACFAFIGLWLARRELRRLHDLDD